MSQTIHIVGLDESKSYKSDRGTKVEFFYIELNKNPDKMWIQLFKDERDQNKHNQTIPFNIEGKYVVIECTRDMLNSMYLKELKSNINKTNQRSQ
jgi:hypothetical protein